jgi:hypothetical protein
VVDTQHTDPANYAGDALITGIPGASADVDVDASGNITTGIGFGSSTGELKIWTHGELEYDNPPATALAYTANTKTVLAGSSGGPLSGAYLGTDADGNLTVGGGNYFGSPKDYGYAALIHNSVVSRVLGGGASVDINNPDEWKELQPDPCGNDSATGIMYGSWSKGMAVVWNPYSDASSCATGDEWHPGMLPRMTIYYPGGAPDSDGDGVPDASDNAYLSYNPNQDDTDGDGYGDVTDADYDNDDDVDLQDYIDFRSHFGATGPQSDFDADGDVDLQDYIDFRGKFNTESPWY